MTGIGGQQLEKTMQIYNFGETRKTEKVVWNVLVPWELFKLYPQKSICFCKLRVAFKFYVLQLSGDNRRSFIVH